MCNILFFTSVLDRFVNSFSRTTSYILISFDLQISSNSALVLKKNLCLILGSDNLLDFHKWTNWKKIVKLSKLIVFSRKGYDKKSKESVVVKYLNKKNIIYINNKLINISSSGSTTLNTPKKTAPKPVGVKYTL